jgi:putative methyltransferase (TIGR04325 family)
MAAAARPLTLDVKDVIKLLTPPIVVQILKRIRRTLDQTVPEWERVGDSWPASHDRVLARGWNVADVANAYEAKWEAFTTSVQPPHPLALSPEAVDSAGMDLIFHNTVMCFAYVMGVATYGNPKISVLDWGGGLGHYGHIAKALEPRVILEYHCKDVSALVERGRRLHPGATFHTDEKCLIRQYDLVLASGSLHYESDWQRLLAGLAAASASYLFVTRLPVVLKTRSFVFIQRPYQYGYNTEYLGWCLNRDEFLNNARRVGLSLVREFITGERPVITGAAEECVYRGYLFARTRAQD